MVNRRQPLERIEVPERRDVVTLPEATAVVPAVPAPPPATPPSAVHRRYARARAEGLLASIRVGDGVVVANVVDISMGGFFASTTQSIPTGAFVELSLLRPGAGEVRVGGVIVDDADHRRGLAVRFEAMSPDAARQVRRIVEELQDKLEGHNADRGVTRARSMRAVDEVAPRDQELTTLRQKVALLTAENNRLRAEAEANAEAEKLVGRLRLEVERLKARSHGDGGGADPALLSDIKRDAEVAWTAIARVSDAIDKIR